MGYRSKYGQERERLSTTSLCNSRADGRTVSRGQEAASRDLAIRPPRALDKLDVNTLEAGVGPLGAAVPRVPAGRRALEAGLVGLRGAPARVERGHVLGELARDARGPRQLETDAAVLVGRVAREGEVARLLVVGEALGRVAEGDAVGHDVVGLGRAAAAQLVPVAVALEGGEVPTVEAVSPRDGVLDCDRGCELPMLSLVSIGSPWLQSHFILEACLPEIKTVINVVPKASTLDDVTSAAALLARKAVRALSLLARVAVHVRVQVQDLVVANATLHLEPGLVVVVRDDPVKDVVVAILEVDSVGPVDQRDL